MVLRKTVVERLKKNMLCVKLSLLNERNYPNRKDCYFVSELPPRLTLPSSATLNSLLHLLEL